MSCKEWCHLVIIMGESSTLPINCIILIGASWPKMQNVTFIYRRPNSIWRISSSKLNNNNWTTVICFNKAILQKKTKTKNFSIIPAPALYCTIWFFFLAINKNIALLFWNYWPLAIYPNINAEKHTSLKEAKSRVFVHCKLAHYYLYSEIWEKKLQSTL